MTCPDDNVLARLLEGALGQDERPSLELHLDGCSACRELLVQLGRAYTRPAEPSSTASPVSLAVSRRASAHAPPARAARWLAPFVSLAALLELTLALTSADLAARASGAERMLYGAACLWAGGSALLAMLAAFGLWQRAAWAASVARTHAWFSLPSLVFTPLALCVLRALRERSPRR
jgi:predicted anti-sigma-YlaC factor YlaD